MTIHSDLTAIQNCIGNRLDDADYYVLGRLAEKLGVPEFAAGLYQQVQPEKTRPAGGTTWHLAQRRLKALEKENARLRKAVSNLTLDALILKEVVEGKY